MSQVAPAELIEALQRSEAELAAIDPLEHKELALERCAEIARLSEQLERCASESRRRALKAGNRLALEILSDRAELTA